jgi:predicted methyltransferase
MNPSTLSFHAMLLCPAAALAVFAAPLVASLTSCASADGAAPPAAGPPAAAPGAESAPAASSGSTIEVDAPLRDAVAGPARGDRERARDVYRHPGETLAFFGVRPDSKVVELWPGGGYYTAILAPYLAAGGKLAITHFDPAGDPKSEDTQEARYILDRLAKTPAVFGKVAPVQIARPDFVLGPDGSADFVFTFRNVHNFIEAGYAESVFAAAGRVLRPGGVLGVEEHRGRPGMSTEEIKKTGYVPEDVVIHLAEGAGLQLAGRSEVNANPRDTKDHPDGVWSLPPTFSGKDVDRAKYAAIGESDRMTLKFVKPGR